MRSLLISPHADDESLFCAFTILRERPHVLVLFGESDQRAMESQRAMEILGASDFVARAETIPNEPAVAATLYSWNRTGIYDRVYAPAIEENGHPHHNFVGRIADEVFGDKVIHYMTYTRAGKSTGTPVPFEPEWPALKLRALAEYKSQLRQANQVEHFIGRSLYEYYQQ